MYTVDELWNLHERSLSPRQRGESLVICISRLAEGWWKIRTVPCPWRGLRTPYVGCPAPIDLPSHRANRDHTFLSPALSMFCVREKQIFDPELQRTISQNWQQPTSLAAHLGGRSRRTSAGVYVLMFMPAGQTGTRPSFSMSGRASGSLKRGPGGRFTHHHIVFCWRLL